MNAPQALVADSIWLHYVLEPAARTLILAGAAWLLLTTFRVREVSLRLAAWTMILYAALAMPFLSRIVPEIPLPILSAQTARQTTANFDLSKATASSPVAQFAVFHPATARSAEGRESAGTEPTAMDEKAGGAAGVSWPATAVVVYLLVMTIFLSRFVLGLASSRRLRGAGTPVLDERLHRLLAREARKAGLERPPQLAQSSALSVPATLGLLRPVILLPVEWTRWSELETGAVLAHEISHVARRDGLTRALSQLHRALFWFSPLSWWLDRTLVELAEQASDDAALRSGADRVGYAEILLHFFRALKAARGRVRWEGVSMAQGSRSERRVERILCNSPLSRGLGLVALATVALAAMPLICLAAAVQLSPADSIPAPLASAPPPPPPLAALRLLSLRAPAASAAPSPALGRVPDAATRNENGWNEADWRAGGAFAVVSGGSLISDCASGADLDRVWNLSREVPASFLWIQRDGRSYIIHDPAIVKAALGFFAPLQAIGREQAESDREESELVREQIEFEIRQMASGFDEPNIWPQLRGLEVQLRAIESAATPEELSRAQAQFARAEWNAMQSSMANLEWVAQMNLAANEQQAAFETRQAALIRKQIEINRKQAETVRQVVQLEQILIEQSFHQDLAKPI